MKNKILLSTLLGGALLAACTADDVLNVEKVAGNVNQNAPVFTVSLADEDDDLTRAVMDDAVTDNAGMKWEIGDKMSLFHNGKEPETGAVAWEDFNFLTTGLKAKQFDAIYASEESADGGKHEFSTAAMVNEGLAIMVFPADTAYTQNDVNPHISISLKQTKATKHLTPYVSEILEIAEHKDLVVDEEGNILENGHTAGYGRPYDIMMRRMAAQLRLKLNGVKGDGLKDLKNKNDVAITPIKYKEVEMTVEDKTANGEAYPFTKEMAIRVGKLRNGVHPDASFATGTQTTSGNSVGTNKTVGNSDDHRYWKYTPWIRVAEVNGVKQKFATISTNDISGADTDVAIFTLLPADEDETVLGDTKTVSNGTDYAEAKFGTPKFTGKEIVVKTTYGKVTIEEDTNGKFWTKGNNSDVKKNVSMNIADGIAEALTSLFPTVTNNTTGSSYPEKTKGNADGHLNTWYEGQIMPGSGTRYLTVDLSTLDMNGLHVTDENNLMDALAVYDELVKTKDVTFILDGAEENKVADGIYKGKFTMSESTWKELERRFADKDNKISLALCATTATEGDIACSAVVLNNTTGKVQDVPALQFVKSIQLSDPIQNNVKVELNGTSNWTYENEYGFVGTSTTYKSKAIKGVDEVIVKSGRDLALGNTLVKATENIKVLVEKDATVSVTGDAIIAETLVNRGTVTIDEAALLRVGNEGVIQNGILSNKDNKHGTGYGPFVADGKILVSGTLGKVSLTTGNAVNNYGTIKQVIKTAKIAVTKNSSEKVGNNNYLVLKTEYDNTNSLWGIGTIELADKDGGTDGNVSVSDTDCKGFMKLTLSSGDITATATGNLANYIVVAGTSARVNGISSNIEYIEINNNKSEVVFGNDGVSSNSGKITLGALLVKDGMSVRIPGTSEGLETQVTYIPNGNIIVVGETTSFDPGSYTGYFGGSQNDNVHVTVTP